ncbi:MAG: RecX family transcriptional regulator [Eubacteriales bacterium]|nr:RecX family transcriptional regulator [Eubacteriales bacterium]
MSKPKKASDTGRSPTDAALRFLGARARTVREVERHLDACEYGEVEVYETVERLKELGLLSDLAYAGDFVRTRLATKPVSRAHLREQLLAHETDAEAIEQALNQVDEETQQRTAAAVAEKYARQYARLPEDERNEMVIRRLLSRGYAYDEARAALQQTTGEQIE